MSEVPFQPQAGVALEQDLQKLCAILSRECGLDMGHEVRRFLASETWRDPFVDAKDFLERLAQAHSKACAIIDAYVVERKYAEVPCAKAHHDCDEQQASGSDICTRCGFPAREHKEVSGG